MLYEFKRKAHLYLDHKINANDHFEWLAIMQHHGAPTRLLDFTYSIFIASYFAAIDSTSNSSIWAINRHVLRDNLHEDYKLRYEKRQILKDEVNHHHINFVNNLICRKFSKEFVYPSTVVPVEPKLLNERLSKQQGLFLMPTNPNTSYLENLKSAFRLNEIEFENVDINDLLDFSVEKKADSEVLIIKFEIPKEIHGDIVGYLRDMNITSELLFPGIDGLAKSLIQTQMRN